MHTVKQTKRAAKKSSESPASMVDAIAKSLGLARMLPRKEQEKLRSRGRRMPIAVIELMADLADEHGDIAGMKYDATAARAALARVTMVRAVAKAALRLARRAESDAVQTFIAMADETMGLTMAMDRLVRNPRHAPLREANERVRGLMRAKRGKPAKPKKRAARTTRKRVR